MNHEYWAYIVARLLAIVAHSKRVSPFVTFGGSHRKLSSPGVSPRPACQPTLPPMKMEFAMLASFEDSNQETS